MNIDIFDVELGQCAMVHCPNGQKIMVDAGHNVSKSWYPSEHFHGNHIERLIISNYDEDHTSDLEGVMTNCSVRMLYRNVSVNSVTLAAMKALTGGMGAGISYMYRWMQRVEGPSGIQVQPADLGGVQIQHFSNTYGAYSRQFTDANNLSLVSFVTYNGFTILFPGDLEIPGWRELLKIPAFQMALSKVTVLVASHHGRENGCCPEIFNFCRPSAVIISDAGLQHATQETCGWYASKVSGCKTIASIDRKVFTTRSDGNIHLQVDQPPASNWYIATAAEKNARLTGTL